MKRRDLILAGVLAPMIGRAGTPCPPPLVSVAGGGSSATPCPTGGKSYSTDFTQTEAILSDGGKWTSGGITGNRSDCASANGRGYGLQNPLISAPPYRDSRACLQNMGFGPDVYAKSVVCIDPSFQGEHELEMLFRFRMNADGTSYGYAFDWTANSGNIYMGTEDGPNGVFNQWRSPFPIAFRAPANGDVIECQLKGWLFTCWINGAQIFAYDVSQQSPAYPSGGGPGIGFYTDTSYGTTVSPGNTCCYSHFECHEI